jgi:hypothetical protein
MARMTGTHIKALSAAVQKLTGNGSGCRCGGSCDGCKFERFERSAKQYAATRSECEAVQRQILVVDGAMHHARQNGDRERLRDLASQRQQLLQELCSACPDSTECRV